MSWAAVGSAAITVAGGLLNKKNTPNVATTAPVNLQAQQAQSVAGNAGNEDSIESLLTKANSFTQDQATSLMEKAIPGYGKLSQSILQSAQEKTDHPYDLPQGVIDNLTRIGAEKGITRGTRGQFNQYDVQRDLGVNMLQFGNTNFSQALQALTQVSGTAPRISPMSPLSMYVTPQQNAQVAAANNQNAQASAQAGNNVNAAAANQNSQNLWDSISKAAGIAIPAITGNRNPGDPTAGNIGTD